MLKLESLAEILSLTSFAGGLETITSTFTVSSSSIASIISIIVIPPTSAFRSRPPIPIAFVTPSPSLSIIVVSSWIPVPEAPMIPIEPFATLFVNAIGTP